MNKLCDRYKMTSTNGKIKFENPAYGRHWISCLMLIVAPILKQTQKPFFYHFCSLFVQHKQYNLFIFLGGGRFQNFWVADFLSFRVTKFPSFQMGGREGGGPMRGLGTDHMITWPIWGLKTAPDVANRQKDKQTETEMATRPGPVGPIQWKSKTAARQL